jgi:hypothetical protein
MVVDRCKTVDSRTLVLSVLPLASASAALNTQAVQECAKRSKTSLCPCLSTHSAAHSDSCKHSARYSLLQSAVPLLRVFIVVKPAVHAEHCTLGVALLPPALVLPCGHSTASAVALVRAAVPHGSA